MRFAVIYLVLCSLKESHEAIPLPEESLVPSQISCFQTARKLGVNKEEKLLVYVSNSSKYAWPIDDVAVYVVNDLDLLEKFVPKFEKLLVVLDGVPRMDFKKFHTLRMLKPKCDLIIVCPSQRSPCAKDIYDSEIENLLVKNFVTYTSMDAEGTIVVQDRSTMSYGSCDVGRLRVIRRCSKTRQLHRIVPRNINFDRCPLRIAVWSTSKYAKPCMMKNDRFKCSMESRITRYLHRELNATPVFVAARSPAMVGDLVENGDAVIGHGNLRQMIGGPRLWYSKIYKYVRGTIVLSRATTQETSVWKNLIEPLRTRVWICLGVTIIIIVVTGRISQFRGITGIQYAAIFTGQPVRERTMRSSTRIFLFCSIYLSFVCIQCYLSNRAQLITSPVWRSYRTLADVEDSDLEVCGIDKMREIFRKDYPRIYRDFRVIQAAEYEENLYDLLVEKPALPTYIEETDSVISSWPENVKTLTDNINIYPIVMVVGNPRILPILNDVIMRAQQHGNLLPVSEQGSIVYYSRKSIRKQLSSNSDGKTLRFKHFSGAFASLLLGLVASFVLFLLELISFVANKITKKKKKE